MEFRLFDLELNTMPTRADGTQEADFVPHPRCNDNGVEFQVDNFDTETELNGCMDNDAFVAKSIGVTFGPQIGRNAMRRGPDQRTQAARLYMRSLRCDVRRFANRR